MRQARHLPVQMSPASSCQNRSPTNTASPPNSPLPPRSRRITAQVHRRIREAISERRPHGLPRRRPCKARRIKSTGPRTPFSLACSTAERRRTQGAIRRRHPHAMNPEAIMPCSAIRFIPTCSPERNTTASPHHLRAAWQSSRDTSQQAKLGLHLVQRPHPLGTSKPLRRADASSREMYASSCHLGAGASGLHLYPRLLELAYSPDIANRTAQTMGA